MLSVVAKAERVESKPSLGVRVLQIAAGVIGLAALGAELFLTSPKTVRRFEWQNLPITHDEYFGLATDGWITNGLLAAPGIELRGLLRPPNDPNAPWLLFLSGNSDRYLAGAKTFLDRIGRGREVGLAVWAYRGFDGSDGVLTAEAFRSDARAMYDALINTFHIDSSKIHVVGFSLGTYGAIALAKSLASDGRTLASITLLAPFAAIDVVKPGMFSRWMPAERFDSVALIQNLAAPMLLVHGRNDDVLPVEDTRPLLDALGDNGGLFEVEGAGHGDLIERSEVYEVLQRVLE